MLPTPDTGDPRSHILKAAFESPNWEIQTFRDTTDSGRYAVVFENKGSIRPCGLKILGQLMPVDPGNLTSLPKRRFRGAEFGFDKSPSGKEETDGVIIPMMTIGDIHDSEITKPYFVMPLVEHPNIFSLALIPNSNLSSAQTIEYRDRLGRKGKAVNVYAFGSTTPTILPVDHWRLCGIQWVKFRIEPAPYDANLSGVDLIYGPEEVAPIMVGRIPIPRQSPKEKIRPLIVSTNVPVRDGYYPWDELQPLLEEGNTAVEQLGEKLSLLFSPTIRRVTDEEWIEINIADPGHGWQNPV